MLYFVYYYFIILIIYYSSYLIFILFLSIILWYDNNAVFFFFVQVPKCAGGSVHTVGVAIPPAHHTALFHALFCPTIQVLTNHWRKTWHCCSHVSEPSNAPLRRYRSSAETSLASKSGAWIYTSTNQKL